jgi:cell division cycle 2-like protein
MLQFLSAVDHMHQNWFIHRDLKTSNLLYQNGVLCVCDFGLARKYGSPIAPYTFEVVTLWYRPTELLLGNKEYSTPLDVWAVGCILAEMLTGKPLFPGEGEIDQINKIFVKLGAPTEEVWPGCMSLPNANKISWKQPTKGKLRDLFATQSVTSFSGGVYLNDSGYDLLTKLLTMDPKQRISAKAALDHPWFKVYIYI